MHVDAFTETILLAKLLWYNSMIVISETPLVSKKSFLKHHHLCIWDARTAPKLLWGCMSLQLAFYKYVLHRHVQVTCSRGNAAMRLLARNWTQLLSLVVLTRFANLGWWTGIAAPDPFTGAACKQCDSYKSTSSKDCGGSMKKSSNCTEDSTIGLLMVALIDVPLKLQWFSLVFSFPSESHVTLKVFPCQEVLRCPGKRRKTWTQALLGVSADFTVLHSWQRLLSANNSVIWGSMIRCIWIYFGACNSQ